MLLGAGANPWLPDADGYTAYDYALDHAKPPAVVAALLEGDARFGEMQRSFQVQLAGCAGGRLRGRGGGGGGGSPVGGSGARGRRCGGLQENRDTKPQAFATVPKGRLNRLQCG